MLFTPRLLSYVVQSGLLLLPVDIQQEARGPKEAHLLFTGEVEVCSTFSIKLILFYHERYKYQAAEIQLRKYCILNFSL